MIKQTYNYAYYHKLCTKHKLKDKLTETLTTLSHNHRINRGGFE